MTRKILVVAPHPDDETLGCGGALLRHRADGDAVHWVIVTAMSPATHSAARREQRAAEVREVARLYGFASTQELGFPSAGLESVPRAELVEKMSAAFQAVRPDVAYLPHPGDSHGDHRAAFEAAASCAKWFREPTLRRVLTYETLSETDAALDPTEQPFRPTVFVDITAQLERKLEILGRYDGEIGEFPFPRSLEAVRALARVRGVASGCAAAEAFQLLKETL
ncbi:MAG: PIG-L deacetylase family protein [Gemmatimonadales bacterium]